MDIPCQSSFQRTVDSNKAIAIAMLSDWLKNIAPDFQPMRSNTKPITPFPALWKVTGNYEEF